MAGKGGPPPKKGGAPKKKDGASKKKGAARAKGRGRGAGGALAAAGWWLLKVTLAVLIGASGGAAIVMGALYRAALEDVDTVVNGPVWVRSGRVVSGPQEVWPGLTLSAEELAQDLSSAGFVRVAKASRPGDMVVSSDGLMAVIAGEGGGEPVEVLVTFQGERVATVSPKGRASFPPAELAVIKGADNDARRPVPLDRIPEHMVHAVLAVEDARFYSHEGVDPIGVGRALVMNLVRGDTVQGGSTLTQQLAKNLFLSQERTWQRKAREALFALALERRLGKDALLELYLNGVYLGQAGGASVYGVDQASRAYFGRPVDRIGVGEAAMLAGIISAPNRYSPLAHPDAARERRDVALGRMVAAGWLSEDSAAAEKKRPLETHPAASGRRAPWVVDAAIAAVEEPLGAGSVAARGIVVATTVQPALQRLAERVVAQSLAELEREHGARGAQMALVALRVSDGAVLAAVGGRDYVTSPYNRAFDASRQLGSTIKPLTLARAFEERPGLSPATRVQDEPIERVVDGKTWRPRNYDGAFQGDMSVRQAIAASRNIPAVLLAEDVGMGDLASFWKGLGLSEANAWPSSSLGAFGATPLQLASAYTIFPGAGRRAAPLFVRRATDPDGAVLWTAEPVREREVSDRAAFLTTTVLEEVLRTGTAKAAATYGVSSGAAGKTGTTDDARDAWMVGFTRELVVVVWVGYDRDKALGLTGGKAALPAWARFVAASGTATGAITSAPANVESAEVCDESGQIAVTSCPARHAEWFSRGSVPTDRCATHGGAVQQVAGAAAQAIENLTERLRDDKKRPLQRLFGRKPEESEDAPLPGAPTTAPE